MKAAWNLEHASVCRALAQLRNTLGLSTDEWDDIIRIPNRQGSETFIRLCKLYGYSPQQIEHLVDALEAALGEKTQDVPHST